MLFHYSKCLIQTHIAMKQNCMGGSWYSSFMEYGGFKALDDFCDVPISCCPIARHHTIKTQKKITGHMIKMYGVAQRDTVQLQSLTCAAPVSGVILQKTAFVWRENLQQAAMFLITWLYCVWCMVSHTYCTVSRYLPACIYPWVVFLCAAAWNEWSSADSFISIRVMTKRETGKRETGGIYYNLLKNMLKKLKGPVSKFLNYVIIPDLLRYWIFGMMQLVYKIYCNTAKNPELWPYSRFLRPDLLSKHEVTDKKCLDTVTPEGQFANLILASLYETIISQRFNWGV